MTGIQSSLLPLIELNTQKKHVIYLLVNTDTGRPYVLSRYVDMYLPLVATRDRHVPLEASRELEACASVPARVRIILRFEGDHRFHSPIYNHTTATDGRTKHIGAEDRAMPPATSCHNQLSIINQQPCSQHIITLHAAGNQQPNQQPPPNRPEVDSYKNSGCAQEKIILTM